MVSDDSLDLDEDNHIYFQMDISNVSRNVNGEGGQNNGSENIQSVETFESFKSNNVPQSEVNVSSGTSNCENENDKLKKPYMGMLFDSIEGATTYYEEYGRQNGFSVRRRSSQRTHTRVDEVTSIKFVCSREGKPNRRNENSLNEETSRSCSTIKRECGAAMRILYRKQLLKWSESKFSDEHNHKLISPIKRVHMRTNRVFPDAAKDLTEKFHQENIPLSKVPSMLGGSEIGFDTRDCYNFLRTNRLKDLEEGDASSVLTYFQRKIRENPQFFYNVQVDVVTGRAVNFFWVDARSRMAYQQFGDVVTFDTTYRTNKYKMPFAPFTGVNHHFQSIQFGCALLQDETEISFLWLFTTWLEAMGGRAPKSFITDQCAAMCAAVRKIFPNTRHRLCLWHIKMKFPEKLSHIYLTNVDFKNRFEKCIHHTYHIEEFEKTWEDLVSEFGLENNEWLQGLFDIRESWVPVYHRNTFYAGMNTTSRSEGVNAFFGDFVSSDTNLRQFVVRYEQALKNIVRKEIDEDYISEHKDRIVSKRDLLLKHASNIYTRNMFDKFREELQKADSYRASDPVRDGVFDKYLVKCKFGAQRDFLVKWNSETHEGFCECSHFQFTGILCKHLLKIFVRLDVDEIPQHFILKRWTKGANSFSKPLVSNPANAHHIHSDHGLQNHHSIVNWMSLPFKQLKQTHINMNVQSAYLHVMGDLIQSIGVMIGGALIWAKPNWLAVDLVCTLGFSVLVLLTTISMIKDILFILMESTPSEIDVPELETGLSHIRGVQAVHDLHVWAISVGRNLLSCHVQAEKGANSSEILRKTREYCEKVHGIHHATIQIEYD